MNHAFIPANAVCLAALLFGIGCGGDKNSDVENSPSAATTIRQSEEAARKGDAHEMMNVGMTYYQGNEDVPQDNLNAYIWLSLAAENDELKNALELKQALIELNKALTETEKANARSQIKSIRAGFDSGK